MEYGSDPTKADDFEAIAAAGSSDSTGRKPILHYHNGRWAVDEAWTNQLNPRSYGGTPTPPGTVTGLAFAAPDDGWMIATGAFSDALYHFDGARWTQCGSGLGSPYVGSTTNVSRDECRDHNRVIPVRDLKNGTLHVTIAGERVYLYAQRYDTEDPQARGVAVSRDPLQGPRLLREARRPRLLATGL
jgi:hypothetical protein